MRALTLLLTSSLSAFALTAGATALPTAIAVKSGPAGTYAGSPICGLMQVADKGGISDGEIAYIYIQANLFEVETAKLGGAQGTASEVKKHGEDVAKDHGGVVKMFQELLLKSNVKPVADAGSAERVAAQEKVVADLKQKSGADFDRAYIAHEVANHRAVIKALRETIIPATSNAQLIAHFNAVLPAFEHHLAMTIDAAKSLGVATDE
ncbi:MAG: DUF4142 domain-containing protein [Hyphomicrobium sp.]|jgi:putative membrane protein